MRYVNADVFAAQIWNVTTRTIKEEVACGPLRVKKRDELGGRAGWLVGWLDGWTSDEIVSPPAGKKQQQLKFQFIANWIQLKSIESTTQTEQRSRKSSGTGCYYTITIWMDNYMNGYEWASYSRFKLPEIRRYRIMYKNYCTKTNAFSNLRFSFLQKCCWLKEKNPIHTQARCMAIKFPKIYISYFLRLY